MKLSAIEKCCKAAKACHLIYAPEGRYIGDRASLYRVDDLPDLDESALRLMWTIEDGKEFDVVIDKHMPYMFDTNPLKEDDEYVTRVAATVCGRKYFRFDKGEYIAVQEKYLAPFANDPEIGYTVRKATDGTRYVCACRGVFVVGYIMPLEPLCEDLLREVGEIYNAEMIAASEG